MTSVENRKPKLPRAVWLSLLQGYSVLMAGLAVFALLAWWSVPLLLEPGALFVQEMLVFIGLAAVTLALVAGLLRVSEVFFGLPSLRRQRLTFLRNLPGDDLPARRAIRIWRRRKLGLGWVFLFRSPLVLALWVPQLAVAYITLRLILQGMIFDRTGLGVWTYEGPSILFQGVLFAVLMTGWGWFEYRRVRHLRAAQ